MMSAAPHGRVVALAGGVGGARLVDGLDRMLPAGTLRVIVNTGDDFEHWGLHISPDLDTVMYTLAGLAPRDRGWGIEGDTFAVLEEAKRRGAEDWFQLGDRDLVTHLERTAGLSRGASLTMVTAELCKSLGVRRPVLPMSDEPHPTIVISPGGKELAFQQWLVRSAATPEVEAIRYQGSGAATKEALRALADAELVVVCPSNPYVSIEPILRLDGVREALQNTKTVGVSPIVKGRAVKGPLARMIPQLAGVDPSARAVAEHYQDLLDGFAVHPGDGFDAPFPLLETDVLIPSAEDRTRLASSLLSFAESLG